ncbi:hypothetical protein [Croceivirga thetidis]|uniref:Uncharacterized protein n=1 Tax=Croceivirga thetidis TaxID=2721623 RepID=A0ABX1GW82_9FLAO|nr:hypothetical protein [Croceivirga thetidis]NKI32982.1 hypothetical protein [Croceivirga thetidis]
MKTYKTIILIICIILAIIGFLMMAAFKSYNACEYAGSSINFIKIQTETALNSKSHTMMKFFSGKALKSMKATKSNFNECGCLTADRHLTFVEQNLLFAMRAPQLLKSKQHLLIVLSGVNESIELLEDFENDVSYYGESILTLNTKTNIELQGGVAFLPKAKEKELQVEASLEEFQKSISKVVNEVECEEAFRFISNIHNEAKNKITFENLSDSKKFYHTRVMEIAQKALVELEGCPAK